MVPHNEGVRKLPLQLLQQAEQAATLLWRARIGRLSGGIQSAFVADAYGVPVMSLAMCAHLFQQAAGVGSAVARDVEVITYVAESPSVDVFHPARFKIQAPPLGGGGAMDDNQGNRSHAVINLHTN